MNLYDITIKNNKGEDATLAQYKGKVLLIVNTATKCGLTPQYEGLENLYKKYADKGFEILDFQCNQFLEQAPGTDEEISSFCSINYGTTFPRFQKIDVNGKNASPLYVYLKEEAKAESEDDESKTLLEKLESLGQKFIGTDIKWNFTKFLIGKDGSVVKRYAPTTKPESIEEDVLDQLSK